MNGMLHLTSQLLIVFRRNKDFIYTRFSCNMLIPNQMFPMYRVTDVQNLQNFHSLYFNFQRVKKKKKTKKNDDSMFPRGMFVYR